MQCQLHLGRYVLWVGLLVFQPVHAALAPGVAAQVVSLHGAGEQRSTAVEPWSPTRAAALLGSGAFVRTLAASKMALLFADDTQIRLNQNSVLQVKSVASASQETTLLLTLGRAWAQTRRAPDSRLNFETPAATAGIRGTDWELDVDASGKTLLTVFSGRVELFNAQGRISVASNEAAVVEIGKAPVKMVLSHPRERIQWVNALSADPLRHIHLDQVAPEFRPALLALAKADLGAASAALAKAANAPADWRFILQSAYAILAGDAVGARQRLATLVDQPGSLSVAYLLMSDLQLVAGEFNQAATTLEAGLVQAPDDPSLLAQLARAQMLADKLTDAEKTLARTGQADNASLLLAQGELARRQGQTAATLQAFTRATRAAPADDRAWYGLGSAQNELEQSALARRHINQALDLQPQGAGYQGELGTLETFANRFAQADQAFAAALAQNPADYVALTGLGLLRLKQGQPPEALEAFLRAGLMEPRYARAKTYTAVAYYQLGRHQDAIDTMQQATALDDKDPVPYLFLSQIYADLLRPGEAVQASREAVKRLPYLKSLNQIANDQKGSANFGASLAFFGLENWALELAARSYSPYWGGSHLFLADRYSGEFNKNSELFQGFLSDPLAFGASNRFSSLLQRAGHYATLELNHDRAGYELVLPSVTLNGLSNSRLPVAYFVQAQRGRGNSFPIDVGVSSNLPSFADPSGQADVDASVITLGLGARPTENLGLFAYHNTFKVALQGHNKVLKFGTLDASQTIASVVDVDVQHSALGLSYRWSPTAQTWLKLGNSKSVYEMTAYPLTFAFANGLSELGTNAKPTKQFDDLQLRHIMDLSEVSQVSLGLEHVREKQYSEVLAGGPLSIYATSGLVREYLALAGNNDIARDFTSLTLAARHQLTAALTFDATLALNRLSEKVKGENAVLIVFNDISQRASALKNETQSMVAPRLGLAYQPSEQFSLRAAYQDWIRPLSISTLSSVQTAGIPVEDRLIGAGGRLKRSVLQLGLTPDAFTHFTARLDHQDIHNPVAPGVDLRTPSLPFLEALRNAQNFNLSTLDVLEGTPSPEDASLTALSLAVNQMFTPRLSGYLNYTRQASDSSFADTDAPSGRVNDRRIAYLPRDTLVLGTSWASGQRTLLAARAIYRSQRFEDNSNLTLWPASWSLDLMALWETQDKRWGFAGGALNLGGNKSPRQFERYVLDARYRF